MLLEQFLDKQLIDMHGASNIMKSGNQFIFIRKYLQNTTFTVL
jgi:hypothetical protein